MKFKFVILAVAIAQFFASKLKDYDYDKDQCWDKDQDCYDKDQDCKDQDYYCKDQDQDYCKDKDKDYDN
jgi:hypothetical protein